MKKTALLFLAIILCFTFIGCGNENTYDAPENAEQSNTAQLSQIELNENNTLTIEGEKYALPVPTEIFLAKGWSDKYDDLNQEIKADAGGYYFIGLYKNDKEKISSVGFYNHRNSTSTLAQSSIFYLKLVGESDDSSETTCSFTLPSGITEKSTYEEVISVYGTPENSYTDKQDYVIASDYEQVKSGKNFEKHGFKLTCKSKNENNAPYNYTFQFNADNTIKYVEIESVNYKAAALSAFDK